MIDRKGRLARRWSAASIYFFFAFPPRPPALRAGALPAAFLLAAFFAPFVAVLPLATFFAPPFAAGCAPFPLFAAAFLGAFFAGAVFVAALAGALDAAGFGGGATGAYAFARRADPTAHVRRE